MLLAGATGYKRYRKNNYFSYVQGSLRTSAFFRLLKKGFLIARRLSFVSFLLTVGTMLLSALETGALFLLISAFYLTFFPFFVLTAGIAILSGILLGSRRRTQLGTAVKNKHVTVFFPVRGSGFAASSFFKANAVCMAAAADSVVLVVTPYFWFTARIGRARILQCLSAGGGAPVSSAPALLVFFLSEGSCTLRYTDGFGILKTTVRNGQSHSGRTRAQKFSHAFSFCAKSMACP